ncbi:DEAD/DEAH box helicase [Geminicoccus roseus]|uniref:DEAD/DEAH box helicase n=1 Tax=Geminicoccus roseus TaxID=404900 RepID=UPI0012FB726D|nr:DEAD/DEAH box helicase [Geminicoccus roseus]
MGVLRWLLDEEAPPQLLLTTAPALLRRVPPRTVWPDAHLEFRIGEAIDLDMVRLDLERIGYIIDERVDEPGEAALRGQVVDLFPAAAPRPCRIEHQDGRITEIRSYDPVSQLSDVDTELLIVDPASEIVFSRARMLEAGAFPQGQEHELHLFHDQLETLLDYAPDATFRIDAAAKRHATDFLDQIAESHRSRAEFRHSGGNPAVAPPDRSFLTAAAWEELLQHAEQPASGDDAPGNPHVPRFVEMEDTAGAFRSFLEEHLRNGRVALVAGGNRPLRLIADRAERATGQKPVRAVDWSEVLASPPGSLLALALPLREGFLDDEAGLAVVAAADLLGSRANRPATNGNVLIQGTETDFRVGDAVVHIEHGMGVLEGLEEVTIDGEEPSEVLRLKYANDQTLMAPVDEMSAIWRYGGDGAAVSKDRLDGPAWPKRRSEVEAEIQGCAHRLVDLVSERRRTAAPKLVPPWRDYERFAARFPYVLTEDQAAAVDAVLQDLAAGRPMDRLVCGDVGFGKTEVALRAAAAAALAGRQVAVVAPTTVLAQQHLRLFQRRFAPFGIEVCHLSRLVKPAEARRVRSGLASGEVRVVVGTHALAARAVRFADLGLVVIDEEQRFGSVQKAKLRALAGRGHVLTMTATPIPRTLQASLIGLQELSVIATPPVLRQPVRTILASFDEGMVREALLREHRRGGQSFVVCPRIEDIEPMAVRLRALVPELRMQVAHGRMPADEIDEVMVGFADGEGDLLLATNIIESGLDVPRANTMLVWRPDRFGLAQLHQLRGRVGRGSRRATAYLLTDPEHRLPPATEKRLRTLEALDRLGAGFAISARDLDLRGAGELIGDEQAGHVSAIGLSLYQHLLDRALRAARGEPVEEEWLPALHLGITGRIPSDYVPEQDVRINLYARAAAIETEADAATFAAEMADRFGPVPASMSHLLTLARIRALCRKLGIARLDGGPQGLALSFHLKERKETAEASFPGWSWSGERLVWQRQTTTAEERLALTVRVLEEAAEQRALPARASSRTAKREKAKDADRSPRQVAGIPG